MERIIIDRASKGIHSILELLQIESRYTAYLLQMQDVERGLLSWQSIPAGKVIARAEIRRGIRKVQLLQVEIDLKSSFGGMTIPEILVKIRTGLSDSETSSARIFFSDNVPNASFKASRRNARS